jgi:universal stress protein E
VWENPPHKGIISRAKMLDVSLVIKTTRKHRKLARHFLSNVDWELVRYCPSPLLLVKDLPWSREPTFIAAVDLEYGNDKPSNLNPKLISSALNLATICDGAVHLYHSAWRPPLSGLYPLDTDSGLSQLKLLALAQDHAINKEVCHCDSEPVALGLPSLTDAIGASAIVMGAISRSRLDRIMIGSTAERVLDELACDVFIIKPDQLVALNQYLL